MHGGEGRSTWAHRASAQALDAALAQERVRESDKARRSTAMLVPSPTRLPKEMPPVESGAAVMSAARAAISRCLASSTRRRTCPQCAGWR